MIQSLIQYQFQETYGQAGTLDEISVSEWFDNLLRKTGFSEEDN